MVNKAAEVAGGARRDAAKVLEERELQISAATSRINELTSKLHDREQELSSCKEQLRASMQYAEQCSVEVCSITHSEPSL